MFGIAYPASIQPPSFTAKGLFALRHRLTPDDNKIITKWLRRKKPATAAPGARTADLQKAHRPRPRVVQDAGAGNWYVVKVTTRNERSAKADFEETGFEVYLPEFKVERFHRSKKVKILTENVLFPGYMFARIEAAHIATARRLESTIDILPGFPAEPRPIASGIIERLRSAQERGDLDDTDAARRKRGETTKNTLAAMRKRLKDKRVRIMDGPFASFDGQVCVVHSFTRIQVLVNIFGRETPLELEMGQVEEMAA